MKARLVLTVRVFKGRPGLDAPAERGARLLAVRAPFHAATPTYTTAIFMLGQVAEDRWLKTR